MLIVWFASAISPKPRPEGEKLTHTDIFTNNAYVVIFTNTYTQHFMHMDMIL